MSLGNEIILAQSDRQKAVGENKSLTIKAEGLITNIRMLCSPYQQDVSKIKTTDVLEHSKELHKTVKKIKENKEIIENITAQLGDGEAFNV